MNFKGRHYVIETRTGRARAPLGEPVLSSAASGWNGIILEQHPSQAAPDVEVIVPHHTLFLQLTPGLVELRIPGWRSTGNTRFAGETVVLPAGTPVRAAGPTTGDLMALTVDPIWVRGQIAELANPDAVEILPRVGIEDPLVGSVLRALAADTTAGSPQGRLYGETLAASLIVHVLRHHVALRVDLNPRRAAIGAPALRRVIEYIDAHLGQGLSLAELAGVAGLSPFHFARVFKRTTGLAPHQFVVRCRVERARDLLVRGQATVADVAAHVGFADQSHLSAHFKRVFGMTPAAFVRSMRNG